MVNKYSRKLRGGSSPNNQIKVGDYVMIQGITNQKSSHLNGTIVKVTEITKNGYKVIDANDNPLPGVLPTNRSFKIVYHQGRKCIIIGKNQKDNTKYQVKYLDDDTKKRNITADQLSSTTRKSKGVSLEKNGRINRTSKMNLSKSSKRNNSAPTRLADTELQRQMKILEKERNNALKARNNAYKARNVSVVDISKQKNELKRLEEYLGQASAKAQTNLSNLKGKSKKEIRALLKKAAIVEARLTKAQEMIDSTSKKYDFLSTLNSNNLEGVSLMFTKNRKCFICDEEKMPNDLSYAINSKNDIPICYECMEGSIKANLYEIDEHGYILINDAEKNNKLAFPVDHLRNKIDTQIMKNFLTKKEKKITDQLEKEYQQKMNKVIQKTKNNTIKKFEENFKKANIEHKLEKELEKLFSDRQILGFGGDNVTFPCPNCDAYIEYDGGCGAMLHNDNPKCEAEFCIYCKQNFGSARIDGAQAGSIDYGHLHLQDDFRNVYVGRQVREVYRSKNHRDLPPTCQEAKQYPVFARNNGLEIIYNHNGQPDLLWPSGTRGEYMDAFTKYQHYLRAKRLLDLINQIQDKDTQSYLVHLLRKKDAKVKDIIDMFDRTSNLTNKNYRISINNLSHIKELSADMRKILGLLAAAPAPNYPVAAAAAPAPNYPVAAAAADDLGVNILPIDAITMHLEFNYIIPEIQQQRGDIQEDDITNALNTYAAKDESYLPTLNRIIHINNNNIKDAINDIDKDINGINGPVEKQAAIDFLLGVINDVINIIDQNRAAPRRAPPQHVNQRFPPYRAAAEAPPQPGPGGIPVQPLQVGNRIIARGPPPRVVVQPRQQDPRHRALRRAPGRGFRPHP